MKIYAIGDLHLSGEPPQKPMDIFDACWHNHWQKIKTDWQSKITPDDLVLVCGDISWGMNLKAALPDLLEIADLPGKKVFIRGNHDYWWASVTKMRAALDENCYFLHNNFYAFDDMAICGSRGWTTPNIEGFTEQDGKTFMREIERTHRSLDMAVEAGYKKIILAMHYPELYIDEIPTGFSNLCDEYHVLHALYGHLHGYESFKVGFHGKKNDTSYHLVSADFLDFKLKQIL